MNKRTLFISIILFVSIVFISIITIYENKKVEELDIGFINEDNFQIYKKFVPGVNSNINYDTKATIRNTKIPSNLKGLYKRAKEIKIIYDKELVSNIPNMYIGNKGICIIKADKKLKQGDKVKISYLTDSRNPLKVGYIYKNKAYICATESTENNYYEVNIPVPVNGEFNLIFYNEVDFSTCIINGSIVIN